MVISNWLKTTVLLAALSALLISLGAILGGDQGILVALMLSMIVNFGAYWFSDRLMLAFYRATEIHPHSNGSKLYSILRTLAYEANLPMPRMYLIENSAPNAFATGRNPEHAAIVVTRGLLSLLSDDELKGVLAHELAHIKHRDTLISTIAATLAGTVGILGRSLHWAIALGHPRERRRGSLHPLILVLFAPLAASLIQLAVSRSREFEADQKGAEICGRPLWLADALLKLEHASRFHIFAQAETHPETAHLFIVNPLSGKKLLALFSTHPPISERVARLKAMAGWGVA